MDGEHEENITCKKDACGSKKHFVIEWRAAVNE